MYGDAYMHMSAGSYRLMHDTGEGARGNSRESNEKECST